MFRIPIIGAVIGSGVGLLLMFVFGFGKLFSWIYALVTVWLVIWFLRYIIRCSEGVNHWENLIRASSNPDCSEPTPRELREAKERVKSSLSKRFGGVDD